MTVTPKLPPDLLDHVLTAAERALYDCGASRVWISNDLPDLAVMAELPGVRACPERAVTAESPPPADLVN